MIDKEKNKQRQAEFTERHTLNKQDVEKLIAEKFERAKMYHAALAVRERQVEPV